MVKDKLERELKSFRSLWKGGTNLARRGWASSTKDSAFRDHQMILDTCVFPYVTSNTTILEIGAGGGGWTQKFLHAKKIYCLDALSAEHNRFWERVGNRDNIEYFQVEDFSCKEIPDDSLDHVFSYDVFCHISYSGARAYLANLYPKMKKNSHGFIMIADANKYFHAGGREKLRKYAGFRTFEEMVLDYDGPPHKGRWYFYGIDRFCELLDRYGYSLVSSDVATIADKLNPIVHFRR